LNDARPILETHYYHIAHYYHIDRQTDRLAKAAHGTQAQQDMPTAKYMYRFHHYCSC